MSKQKVIAVVGPTASGKTALGIHLAQKLGGEVVSADSRQIYKGLDIGTGKATKREMAGIPHHLLDVASPKRQFTAEEFVKKAHRAIFMINHKNRLPIVVGGTGFYVDGLLGRMAYAPVPPNPALRKKLAKCSAAQLMAKLRRLDSRRAREIDPRNKVRLIRAVEIAKALGSVPKLDVKPQYDVLWLGLNPQDLEARIVKRVQTRMRAGMVAEAKRLHARGISHKRMEELGLEYRFLSHLIQGKLTLAQFTEQLERGDRRYAIRQMRWFKRNKDIHWVANKSEALQLAKAFLKR